MSAGDTQAEGCTIPAGSTESIQPPGNAHWSVRALLSSEPSELKLTMYSKGNIEASVSLFKGSMENIPVNNSTFIGMANQGHSGCIASYHAVRRK